MTSGLTISRRKFLAGSALVAGVAVSPPWVEAFDVDRARYPLAEFSYGDVVLAAGIPENQVEQTQAVLMQLDDDALLKPFRLMAGKPAPGRDIGGWYRYDPDYVLGKTEAGFAPGHSFGQWVSALSRGYAITGSPETRDRVLRLNRLLAESISGDYFEKTRFPAYSYDKLVCGLIDAQKFAGDPEAFATLAKVTDIAAPHLPGRAVEREMQWRPGKDSSFGWDESYTMPENLFLAGERGAGDRYRELAAKYLMDSTFFDPLSRNENVLAGRHAYSTVNSLSSGMQAYLAMGSEKHLLAVKNAYAMLMAQSYATGGWGPDEQLGGPDSDELFSSLTKTHQSFETPCGAYAHFKLTRYLMRVTRDSRYGDSMERVLYNTVLGAQPLQPDGRAFYYSDYNLKGQRVYSNHVWPCCSGTLPQIAADYRISGYFRDGSDVYVNLYLPSTLRWMVDGKSVSLTQATEYPRNETVRIKLRLDHSAKFALSLRIPAWAEGASVSMNGKQLAGAITAGSFLRLERKWRDGDEVALTLPMSLRLEAIGARHPDTTALMNGPIVLFAIGDSQTALTARQMLAARRVETSQWLVENSAGSVKFVPFTAIGDDPYRTYLQIAG